MTHNDDFIGLLEDYFDAFDGVTPLPDRVRDAIRAELPTARQVHPRPGLERVLTMLSNTSAVARLGLAAAVLVVAVVLGGAFLNNGSRGIVGGGPTPTPAPTIAPSLVPTQASSSNPTSAPTVAPSVSALPPSLAAATYVACAPADAGKGCLAGGTYQLSGGRAEWPVTVTIDVPSPVGSGWFEWSGGSGWDAVLAADPPNFDGSGWGVMFTSVSDVYRDACDVSKGTIPAAQVDTPEKLAAAIAAWPGFTATAPRAITVDGHSALELTLKGTSKTANCGTDTNSGASGNTWLTLTGTSVDGYPVANPPNGHAYPTTVRIVDTGHGLLVIRAAHFPETSPAELDGGKAQSATQHTADQAGLRAILDSVRLVNTPTP